MKERLDVKHSNVILCTSDQLRPFALGCYGNEYARTPNIDRFADTGARFATAVSNFPVCMPARSVLLSGQYNRTCTGGESNVSFPGRPGRAILPEYPDPGRPHLPDPTLAEVLRAVGYHCEVIGKWHIHSWPHDVGFDRYLIPRVHHCHTGQSYTRNGASEFVPPGYSVEFEADEVDRFLRERKEEGKPFFLYYNISPPHCPLADAPEEYRTMFHADEVPIRPNVDLSKSLPGQDFHFRVYRWDFRFYDFHLPFTEQLPSGYGIPDLTAEYYGLVAWMDHAFGRMVEAVRRNKLDEDTIIVFTSDHGDNLGSHGLVQKGGYNEESIRVPLLIRIPGAASAPVVDRCVASLVDIAPTILELLDLPKPAHMAGCSLGQAMEGTSNEPAQAYVETSQGAALRTKEALYALPYVDGTRTLASRPDGFFDMEGDHYQMTNLCEMSLLTDSSLGKMMRNLDEQLRAWDVGIPWMETNNQGDRQKAQET